MPSTLTHKSYGKSKVRMTKVVRHPSGRHDLFEFDVSVKLDGDFSAAYTEGDNRLVIATDTIKNAVYVVAKEKSFGSAEEFALQLSGHFVHTYPQVTYATVEIRQTSWRRIAVGASPHDFSFTADGAHKRFAGVMQARNRILSVNGGVVDLQVLKTTGSEWKDFHSDKYRTLRDTSDRILATSIDATWTFYPEARNFNAAYDAITEAILATFAENHSLGAQQTIMQMGEAALAACPDILSIGFVLPNQHRIPFNLEPFGLEFENDIFVATSEPFGEIQGTVTRS